MSDDSARALGLSRRAKRALCVSRQCLPYAWVASRNREAVEPPCGSRDSGRPDVGGVVEVGVVRGAVTGRKLRSRQTSASSSESPTAHAPGREMEEEPPCGCVLSMGKGGGAA